MRPEHTDGALFFSVIIRSIVISARIEPLHYDPSDDLP